MLSTISDNLVDLKRLTEEAQSNLNQRLAFLPSLKIELDAATRQWEYMKKNRQLETDIDEMKSNLAWALVRDATTAHQLKDYEFNQLRVALETSNKDFQNAENTRNSRKEAELEKAEFIRAQKSDVGAILESIKGLREMESELLNELQDIEAREIDIQVSVRAATSQRDVVAQKAEDELINLMAQDSAARDAREKKQAEIDSLKEQRSAHQAKARQAAKMLAEPVEEASVLEVRRTKLNASLVATEKEIKSIDKVVLNLRMSEKDRILAFRPQTRSVFYAISQMQWNETPIGPLGLYLTLTDNTYQLPIEVLLGKYLHAFIVSNREDEVKLKSVMTRENCKDMVIRRDAVDIDFESAAFISKQPCYSHSRGPLKTILTELRNPSTIPADSAKRHTRNLVLQQLVIFCKLRKDAWSKLNMRETANSVQMNSYCPLVSRSIQRITRSLVGEEEAYKRELELIDYCSQKQERRHNRQVNELSLEIENLEDNLKENESGSVGIYEEQKKKLNDDLHKYSIHLETLQKLKADQNGKLQDCRNEIAAENKCKSLIESEIFVQIEQLKEMQTEGKDLSADLAGRRAVCEAHHDRFVAMREQVSALKTALDADTIKAQKLVPRKMSLI
ncbi:Structural maintenance of chromosomes protein 6 [Chytriomyces hyalinus]|nr:Structural maintenance of chromosomes protein 6 [Chytriomyces hyalinus]